MTINQLCEMIHLPKDLIRQMDAVMESVDFCKLSPILDQLIERDTAHSAYEQLIASFSEDTGNIRLLICYLECCCRQYARFLEKGISEQIYIDTMKCFTRFSEECYQKYGSYYFERGPWAYRQVSMSLFRIGELEYELVCHEGKPALSLHIPSDADFRSNQVDASLRQAREFFSRYYPEYANTVITCWSWLLSPQLGRLLNEDSNILSFQKRFQVLETFPEAKDYLGWLYRVSEDTPYQNLREETSLQRNVKKHLIDGGYIGAAFGIMMGN